MLVVVYCYYNIYKNNVSDTLAIVEGDDDIIIHRFVTDDDLPIVIGMTLFDH